MNTKQLAAKRQAAQQDQHLATMLATLRNLYREQRGQPQKQAAIHQVALLLQRRRTKVLARGEELAQR